MSIIIDLILKKSKLFGMLSKIKGGFNLIWKNSIITLSIKA